MATSPEGGIGHTGVFEQFVVNTEASTIVGADLLVVVGAFTGTEGGCACEERFSKGG